MFAGVHNGEVDMTRMIKSTALLGTILVATLTAAVPSIAYASTLSNAAEEIPTQSQTASPATPDTPVTLPSANTETAGSGLKLPPLPSSFSLETQSKVCRLAAPGSALSPSGTTESLNRAVFDCPSANNFTLKERDPLSFRLPRDSYSSPDGDNNRLSSRGLNLNLPRATDNLDLRQRLDRAITFDLKLGDQPVEFSLNTGHCGMRARAGLCFKIRTN